MRFVCPDGEPTHEAFLRHAAAGAFADAGHDLCVFAGVPCDSDEWVERLRGADGILLGWKLPAGVLGRLPSVRLVSFLGTGAERFVDLQEARASGVTVCNVPSYGANAIAEHAVALMFAVARRIPALDHAVRNGEFPQWSMDELRGRRLGIVGLGPIGARVAEIAAALDMDVQVWTRGATPERAKRHGVSFTSLENLFDCSEIVSIHLAHVPETEGLIGRDLLERLPHGAMVINTARAELLDNIALAELVAASRLRGAGIDVFNDEPPARSDPLLAEPNVVLTAHVAYNTEPAVRELYRIAIENATSFAAGLPVNVVGRAA